MTPPKQGVIHIAGDHDKPANRVSFSKDGRAKLSRAWSDEELAAFERIENIYLSSIDKRETGQRDHIESVKQQLNRAAAFASSAKARKLYRDALEVIEQLTATPPTKTQAR